MAWKMNVDVNIASAESEFNFIVFLIKRLPFYEEQKYFPGLPEHPVVDMIKAKIGQENPDFSAEKKIFAEEVYDRTKYEEKEKEIKENLNRFNAFEPVFEEMNKDFGFKLCDRYAINLTMYGPGGGYYNKGNVGGITFSVRNRKWALGVCVHEMIHLGIEEDIVQKQKLEHVEKECVVDFVCSKVLEGYQFQDRSSKALKYTLEHTPDAMKKLPQVVADFKHAQEVQKWRGNAPEKA